MPLTDEWEKFVAEYAILPPSDGGTIVALFSYALKSPKISPSVISAFFLFARSREDVERGQRRLTAELGEGSGHTFPSAVPV